MSTWTITFGECVENHAGMQKIGEMANEGFSYETIVNAGYIFQKAGFTVEFYDLSLLLPEHLRSLLSEREIRSACLLIVRNGINYFFHSNANNFIQEVKSTVDRVDKKAYMRGKVVNKHARWNLCYADEAQEPDFENGKGTIIPFREVPYLNNLFAELNYYYDIRTTYIGQHGDSERKKVVGFRFGEAFPLYFQWYCQSERVSNVMKLILNEGDVYFMGEKTTGNDWKKRKVPTLRHAAELEKNVGH